MSTKSVLCIAPSEVEASLIVGCLKDQGFSNNAISALLPDRRSTRDFAYEKGTKAPEGATAGAGAGAVLGGALGWLAGIGALAIPGVGPFVAAGPIAAALSAAALGGAVGGVTGALVGLGIPEYEAKRFEGKLKDGNILISVHVNTPDEVKRVKEIFKEAHGEDIAVAGEASVSESQATDETTIYANPVR